MMSFNLILIKRRTVIISTFLLLMLIPTIMCLQLPCQDNLVYSEITREQLLEDFSLFLLYPYIQEALTEYYGHPKSFWQDEIIDIRKVEIKYRNFTEITVEVETFEGAHNPPRGKDTITFRTDEYSSKVKILHYVHQDL